MWIPFFLFQGIIGQVPEIILKCVSRDEAALAVAQKVFLGFLGQICVLLFLYNNV